MFISKDQSKDDYYTTQKVQEGEKTQCKVIWTVQYKIKRLYIYEIEQKLWEYKTMEHKNTFSGSLYNVFLLLVCRIGL